MANVQKDTLTSTSTGGSIAIRNGWLSLTGTWAGTVNLQTQNPDGSWSSVTDGSGNVIALTTNANCPIDNSIPMLTRVSLTYTSGTLVSYLTDSAGNRLGTLE